MSSPDAELANIAQPQAGAFTRAQALGVGLSPERIEARLTSGQWQALHPSVYLAGTTKVRRETRAIAARLYCGGDALFSHLTAARLLGFDMPLISDQVWLSIPHTRRARNRPGVVITRTRHMPPDPARAYGQPVTPPARTVVDLAFLLHREQLTNLMYDLIHRHVLQPDDVLRAAEGLGSRPGLGRLRSMLAEFDPVFDSNLEVEAAKHFAAARIKLEPQVEVWDGWLLLARVDFADRERKLAIEIDGHRWHSSREARNRDYRRDRELRRRGWTVRRFTTDDVRQRPLEMIREILDCIAQIDRRMADTTQ